MVIVQKPKVSMMWARIIAGVVFLLLVYPLVAFEDRGVSAYLQSPLQWLSIFGITIDLYIPQLPTIFGTVVALCGLFLLVTVVQRHPIRLTTFVMLMTPVSLYWIMSIFYVLQMKAPPTLPIWVGGFYASMMLCFVMENRALRAALDSV